MSVSRYKRDAIEAKIRDGHSRALAADSCEALKTANEILQQAVPMMKDGWEGFSFVEWLFRTSDGRMTHEDRDACWTLWKTAKNDAKHRREILQTQSFSIASDWVSSIWNEAEYGNPHEALKRIKRVQNDISLLCLHRDQRVQLRDSINGAWERAVGRIKQHKSEAERRREDWQLRMTSHLHRWEEMQENKELQIARRIANIENNRVRIANARSAEYATKVAEWIEDDIEKIRKLESEINELTEKIRDVLNKLKE